MLGFAMKSGYMFFQFCSPAPHPKNRLVSTSPLLSSTEYPHLRRSCRPISCTPPPPTRRGSTSSRGWFRALTASSWTSSVPGASTSPPSSATPRPSWCADLALPSCASPPAERRDLRRDAPSVRRSTKLG